MVVDSCPADHGLYQVVERAFVVDVGQQVFLWAPAAVWSSHLVGVECIIAKRQSWFFSRRLPPGMSQPMQIGI